MTSRRPLYTLLIVALIVLAAILFALSQRAPIKIEFVSPLPIPGRMLYIPAIMRQGVRKCAAVGGALGNAVNELREAGVDCTYTYWPWDGTLPGIDVQQMVVAPKYGLPYALSSEWVLGFNEPDLNRDPITPERAAVEWRLVELANPTRKLVSPAPSHLHPDWLYKFYNAYLAQFGQPPRLNALAIHCYQDASVCMAVVNQVLNYANAWNVPEVWVTEFAFSEAWSAAYPSGDWRIEADLFIDWARAQKLIARLYWWATRYESDNPEAWWSYGWHTNLLDWDTGMLTERGAYYKEK